MKPLYPFALTALAAALLATGARADDAAAPSIDPNATELSPVVVTATRTPVTANDALAAVTVISHDQITQSGARDVGDLLSQFANVDVVRSGPLGQQTSIFMRGSSSTQTLVMVDGVRMNTGTSGEASIQNLRPEDIDHIEVVGGAGSTLYGADAIGGVINIITRTPNGKATDIDLTAGGERTVAGSVRQNFQADAFSGALNYGGMNTHGYPIFADADDRSGYRNTDGGGELDYHKDDLTVRGHFQVNAGEVGYLDFGAPVTQDFLDSLGTVETKFQVTPTYLTTLRLSFFHDHLNQNQDDPYAFPTAYDFIYSTRRQADWQNDYTLPNNNLVTIGGTYKTEKVDELSYGSAYDQELGSTAGYIQDQFQAGHFSAQVGGRLEHDILFGQHETANLALGWAFDKANRVYASGGSAFRAPVGDELFNPGNGGNPLLQPEHSLNNEVGFHHEDSLLSLNADVYDNHVHNLITYDPNSGELFNVDRTRLHGAELALGLHGQGWSWQNQAAYVRPEDEDTGQDLKRVPRRTLTSTLDGNWDRYSAGINVKAASESGNSAYDTIVLPGYAVYGLHAGVKTGKHTTIRVNVDNLANKHYGQAASGLLADGDTRYYQAQPRLVSLTLNTSF